ncbi:MAG: SRPBCC domain-containing protein [Arenibacter sp.]|uniref:SRPBCC domain-containing protein n=1 Tax=Arenibacter TaxID=178469 RepID=UPI000A363DB9|nr:MULTISPECIES: SRPBCC domain-containing protein [Arenibacter]MDX1327695.1 SRPBCC domain-containing protein [Arenibacter sp.]
MKLISKAFIQIQKPVEEVFESIVNPAQMTQYFISESSGRLDSEEEIVWKFPEFDETFPLSDIEVKPNSSVSFVWDPATVVKIVLEPQPDHSTVVRVSENGKELNEKNMEWLIDNTGGWANFLACMKAYLEYGISLRKGAYDFLKN